MRTRLVIALMALLLGAGILPAQTMAASFTPAATQCSPAELSRLSQGADSARTTWSQTLTADAYAAFKSARDALNQRRSACSLPVSSATPGGTPVPGANVGQTQSTSGAPVYVPADGIAVDIRSASDQVIAGLPVTYTVTVTTGSNDVAASTNVSVFVILPVFAGGPQFLDTTGGCVGGSPTLSCTLGSIAPHGASRSFLVRMSTPPDLYLIGTTALVAVATVSRAEPDPVSADDSDLSSTLVTEQSDLRILKYMLPTSPIVGETAQYTIYVENYGPSTARDVRVRDTLLAGPADGTAAPMTIQSCAFSVSQGGGSITQFTCTTGPVVGTQFGTDAGTFGTNRIDPIDFNAPPDDSTTGRLRASFRLVFNRALTQVNTATVESPTPDPDWSNNHAETITDVQGASNVSIDKTGPTDAGVGETVNYTLTVTNTGTGYADNVVATDYLPAELGNIVATPSQGSCSTGVPGDPAHPLACNLGHLDPGDSATVGIEARVLAMPAAGSTIFNDAQVASSPADADNADNVDTVSTTVHQTCAVKPVSPTLLSPNGVTTAGRRVLLDWADTSCATRYKVRVYKDAPVGIPIRFATLQSSEIVFRLPRNKTIYWQVRACNKIGCSPWSAPFSFMTPP